MTVVPWPEMYEAMKQLALEREILLHEAYDGPNGIHAMQKTLDGIWAALGIKTYEDAKGKNIIELVAEAVEDAWKYKDLSK